MFVILTLRIGGNKLFVRKTLKEMRLKKHMTQQNVADKIGLTRMGYSKIENCTRDPSFKILLKIKELMAYENDNLFDIYKNEKKIEVRTTFKISKKPNK